MSRNIVSHFTNYRKAVCSQLKESSKGLKMTCIRVAVESESTVIRDVAHDSQDLTRDKHVFL